jgi:hypothetical protein
MNRAALLSVLTLAGCPLLTTTKTTDSATGDLVWYYTCGDPACSGYGGPFKGIDLCSDLAVSAGQACDDADFQCDPVDDCNALLVCATEDPQDQTGGCPISLRKYKDEVHYLSPAERSRAAQQALELPLATWRYKGALDDGKTHLGFLIDDIPASPAVAAGGGHVDLYGYTSLTLAAVQQQQAQIDQLRAEIEALKSSCNSGR